MQEKTNLVAMNSEQLGLRIYKGKSKLLNVNITSTPVIPQITLQIFLLKEVDSFTYLVNIVNKKGGTDADVKVRINKTRTAFHQLKISRHQETFQTTPK